MSLPEWAARTDADLAAAIAANIQLQAALHASDVKRGALGEQIVGLVQRINDLERELAGAAGKIADAVEAKAADVHPDAHGNTRSAWLAAARHARGCK